MTLAVFERSRDCSWASVIRAGSVIVQRVPRRLVNGRFRACPALAVAVSGLGQWPQWSRYLSRHPRDHHTHARQAWPRRVRMLRLQYHFDARTQARVLDDAELRRRDIKNRTLNVVTVRMSVLRIAATKRLPVKTDEIRVRATYTAA